MAQLVIENPDGNESELLQATVDSMSEPIIVLKLKNVVVEEMSLYEILSMNTVSLKTVKLESVSLIIDSGLTTKFDTRVKCWINIISYLRNGMQLEQIRLISLGWRDRNHHITLDQRLETPQAKYSMKCFGPFAKKYCRLSKTSFEANGSLTIRDGLEKMIEEV